ncbi:MAG: hypothetical protein ACJ798_15600 [Phenylobacterium sp.]
MRRTFAVMVLLAALAGAGAALAQSDQQQQDQQRQRWEEQQASRHAQREAAGQKWRDLAADARRRAALAATPELKAKWLRQAQGLDTLADHAGQPPA